MHIYGKYLENDEKSVARMFYTSSHVRRTWALFARCVCTRVSLIEVVRELFYALYFRKWMHIYGKYSENDEKSVDRMFYTSSHTHRRTCASFFARCTCSRERMIEVVRELFYALNFRTWIHLYGIYSENDEKSVARMFYTSSHIRVCVHVQHVEPICTLAGRAYRSCVFYTHTLHRSMDTSFLFFPDAF